MTRNALWGLVALLLAPPATLHAAEDTRTAPSSTPNPKTADELRVRDGLPNFFAKLAGGGPVRIAYLGGSITAADGWRPKSFAWFKTQYPHAELFEINAAISGTGSDYGACRIASDVLSKNPDLVFMEHRVNGGGGFEAKSVEGIVRQVWKHNPHTDICLVYTLSLGMLKELQAGNQTSFGAIMEAVANAYHIPSIDLGVEIAKRVKVGELVFKSDAAVPGKLVFSKDGVHPGSEGHDLYRDVIARSMLAMQSMGKPQAHSLPTPLEPHCWETASLVPITRAVLSSGWKAVDAKTDAIYGEDLGRTEAMLRGAMKCDRTGETITFEWNGTTLGFSDIPQGSGMEVEATIDQTQPPVTIQRPQTDSTRHYARFFYLPEQAPGQHTAVLRVKRLPEGMSFYAGQILAIGTVAALAATPASNALPGRGLAEHDFFYAGEAKEENMYIVKGGHIVWSYSHPGRGEISDAILLPNNNVLFAHQYAITEVTADKRVVWNYDAPPNTEIHTAQPFGTNSVWFVQNGDPAKFMIVNKTSGKTEREFMLPVKNPKGVHGQFRQARMTPTGTLVVAHMDLGKAVEYDLDGKALWSAEVPGIWSAKPLKNGNILATSNRGFVRELNRQGQAVWEWTQADSPHYQMTSLQTATRLANGNTLINNWFNQWSNTKLDRANPPVQAIEVNREKQVVWVLRSWTPPEDLGPSTTIQILDELNSP